MSIPATILSRWAAYPGPARSAAAHAKVKGALEFAFRGSDLTVDVFLQGSYRGYVNTKSESDVDLVAELTSICEFDTRHLSPWEAQQFWANMQYVRDGYGQFRLAVKRGLVDAFGNAVIEHRKAIEVAGSLLRMKVDVLPALSYHQVVSYDGTSYRSHHGIAFWVDGRRIVNWPQHHFDNGVAKNEATLAAFKPAVRMLKNARTTAVQRNLLAEGSAPSYFLQSLLWNVPDECFTADLASTYCNVLTWLRSNESAHRWFLCENGIDPLFGPTPLEWNTTAAFQVETALIQLWNSWK